jgi:AcrR family transcriptional regulator
MAQRVVVPEPERRRRRPTKQGVVLSEQLIVETAIRLVGAQGATALSVRRLGLALGADPSAVYRYFRGTDDLLLALADEMVRRALDGWASSGQWRTDLRDLGMRLHAAYLSHPQVALLAAHRTTGRVHETRAVEAVIGVLRTAGFPDTDLARIHGSFADLSLAFAALDAAALALPPAAAEADRTVWRDTYPRLDAATHPNIAATVHLLTRETSRSAYPFALDLFLDALAARLAPTG